MRRILTAVLTLIIAAGLATPMVLSANQVRVLINGVAVDFEDQSPVIVDGHTLVPVRAVFEALGFEVGWDEYAQMVILWQMGYVAEGIEAVVTEITITIDSPVFNVNDREVTLEVPAQIIGGRTLLPIRALVESLDMIVGWHGPSSTVFISTLDAAPYEPEFAPGALANQIATPAPGEQIAIIHTNFGQIYLRLFPQYAPLAVENFVTHAQNGFYDGLIFHRIIEDFMIQGGCPLGTGTGGESIWGGTFECEFTFRLRHIRGALAMANAGPGTNGSQFYIVQNSNLDSGAAAQFTDLFGMKGDMADDGDYTFGQIYPSEFQFLEHYLQHGGTPHLDFAHTVFGQVFAGMDVVDAIAAAPRGQFDRPLTDIIIERIEILYAQ